ncbi:type I restriction-modification system subunit M [Wenyingzhuangia sp. IMCC45533]
MITGEIKSKIDSIWNDFWTNGISNPMMVIEQFSYLIFLKQLDDRQIKQEQEASLLGLPIETPIYTEAQAPLRYSRFKNLDPQSMFDLFTKPQRELGDITAFDFMKQVGTQGGVFSENMKGATFMIASPKLLSKVVDQIDTLPLDNRDTKGDLYEYMLGKIAESGQNGQFRTPRHIIKMMVELMQPTKEDTVCDPSCGTAGFLVSTGEYIYDNKVDWFSDAEFRNHFESNMFNGLEFDPTMVRIGAMNLQLHGIDNPDLLSVDSLSKNNTIENKYSLILANPPFKGSLDYDDVENSLLQTTKTKKTELLFLSLILRMMTIGGRAAVIVPDGVLFGSSTAHKSIRKELVANQRLQAVISMPSGVFKPYAGVSTAILIFTKTNHGGTDNVWFYDMKADGLSLDDKRNPITENDIPDIIARYSSLQGGQEGAKSLLENEKNPPSKWARGMLNTPPSIPPQGGTEANRKRTQQSFTVPLAEIEANDWDLSINRYKEIVYEEVQYEAPSTIIANIKTLENQRTEALLNLEKLMK